MTGECANVSYVRGGIGRVASVCYTDRPRVIIKMSHVKAEIDGVFCTCYNCA